MIKLLGITLALAVTTAQGLERKATPEWTQAVRSAYSERDVTNEGEGLFTSMACFDATSESSSHCKKPAFLSYDSSKRVRLFKPPKTRLARYGSPNYVGNEVGLLDCRKPIYVLRPYYFSKTTWISLKRFSIEADGRLVIDRILDTKAVQQNKDSVGYEESITVIADEQMLQALRQVAHAKKTVIRLFGGGGTAAVPTKLAANFAQDVSDALEIYDSLSASISEAAIQSCATN